MISFAAERTCFRLPLVVGRYPGRSTDSGQRHVNSCSWTSFGMSTSTGPGRPVRAMWKASRIVSASSFASLTRKLCLVIGIVMPVMSASWNASLPTTGVGTCPVIATIGTESIFASASAVTRLQPPGPEVAMATPTFPVAQA